jgi:hypothetical protein
MTLIDALRKAIEAEAYTQMELTELPVIGRSPWGDDWNPAGVWAWSEPDDEVLVGEGRRDMRMVSYREAREIFIQKHLDQPPRHE